MLFLNQVPHKEARKNKVYEIEMKNLTLLDQDTLIENTRDWWHKKNSLSLISSTICGN